MTTTGATTCMHTSKVYTAELFDSGGIRVYRRYWPSYPLALTDVLETGEALGALGFELQRWDVRSVHVPAERVGAFVAWANRTRAVTCLSYSAPSAASRDDSARRSRATS